MAITTFAAIDVGSNELAMKIYQVSKKDGIRELDHIRYTMELGSETYTHGKISIDSINELCTVLTKFTKKMKEYDVSDYTACATSGIREAVNHLFILDQIKLRCDMKVKILSNSEQRYLYYKGLSTTELNFDDIIKRETAIVDVGSGSIQISLFKDQALMSTQNILLGSLRVRELLGSMNNQTTNFNSLVSEYMDNDFNTYRSMFLNNFDTKNIIGVGERLGDLFRYSKKYFGETSLNKERFLKLFQSLTNNSLEDISKELHIAKEQASLLLPTALIYYKMLHFTKAESLYFCNITLCDGIVADYAEKKEKVMPTHNFTNDIISASRNIASRYDCDIMHTNNVEYVCMKLFDSLKKIHGMSKRDRLFLQIAAILHSCGEYVNLNKVPENSYRIIMSTEIIGISHSERELIANIVRFNVSNFPNFEDVAPFLDKEHYLKIAKLTSLLRIANALDKSHKQKFDHITITRKGRELYITVDTLKDITLEQGLFLSKADFFEEVYGIRPILKQKRSLS
ncbi:exopolyphosphatase [Lachnospiraceae bacterium KM106-2]|nr:exopolyphosphatase [Lachnospiraceae bacterium KM106-2]